jgi:hypothetical protein
MVGLEGTRFDERELSLPADLSRLLEARRFAADAAADFGSDEGTQQQIKLAANEAVANAMEHGSNSRATRWGSPPSRRRARWRSTYGTQGASSRA